ncbi:MAG: DUF6206 family protein [Acidobacteria bacterium]|nr:DUF6206 family protein [Acidobacteriota bacterium]
MNNTADLPPGLDELENRVDQALSSGDESAIEVLGYGEISCVLAWRREGDGLAAKRLPLFDTDARFARYTEAFGNYLEALDHAGLQVVPSRLATTPAANGQIAAWCLQPLLDPKALAPEWLRTADDNGARRLLGRIADHVVSAVGPTLGLDGQLSNWAVVDGEARYFDVTTPMMRDAHGHEVLDTDLFLASLPFALRGLVRRFLLHTILDKYYDPRGVLVDLLGNLIKEGADARLSLGLEVVNSNVEPAVTETEVRRYYREDALMWELLQLFRRVDRAWQRRIRRRQYPFLLPGKVKRRV